MTLVACTINHKAPFLIGDILMSSTSERDTVKVPTNNFDVKPYLAPENPFKIDSLAQKIYVIQEKVCIAFAGREFEIKRFLIGLKERCKLFDKITKGHIDEFLNEYNLAENFSRSAFFMLLIEHIGEESISVGMYNWPGPIDTEKGIINPHWKSVDSDVYEKVYACGSGRDEFLSIIKQTGSFQTFHSKGDIMYAIQSQLSLIARMLAIEKATLLTLKDNWGGGFETAFYNGRNFEKISDIAYIIAKGEFDETGDIDLPFPELILYYTYISETLRIVAVELQKASKSYVGDKIILKAKAGSYTCECFDVYPIDGTISNDAGKDFSFHTSDIAVGYSIVTPQNGVFNPAYFNRHPDLTISYKHNESIEIILSASICQDIRTKCKEAFDSGQI